MKYERCECGGKVTEKKVRVDYRHGDDIVIFEGVPVGVCNKCGERIFDAKILKIMEFLATSRKKAKKVIPVPVMEFSYAY